MKNLTFLCFGSHGDVQPAEPAAVAEKCAKKAEPFVKKFRIKRQYEPVEQACAEGVPHSARSDSC